MLPLFPSFKKIEITDKEAICAHSRQLEPYSDFDFGSMWSWDYSGHIHISQLNGNLVLKFSDYITGDFFYTFIGTNQIDLTTEILLESAQQAKLLPYIKLLPQEVAAKIDGTKFDIEIDHDNTDYILSSTELSTLSSPELSSKRRAVNIFKRNFGDVQITEINLRNLEIQKQIYNLYDLWSHTKEKQGLVTNEHEQIALTRCIDYADSLDLISFSLNYNSQLIAFWILGRAEKGYCISHFEKADTENFNGIFPFFKMKVAQVLISRYGINFINLEQDLGIPGLRQSKQAYKPKKYLHKYIIQYKS